MISSVAFSPDGRTLASGSDDTNVKLWDATSGQELRTLSGHMGRVESVAFSPDGRWIASGASTFNESSVVKLWDAVSGRELRTLTGHARLVLGANPSVVAFSPDSSVLASGGWDGAIYLWDVSSGRELRTLAGPKGRVNSLAFSPDGRTFASGSDDVEIKLWDVTNGQELRTLTGHKYAVQSVAFSPDGRTLASASLDTTVKLWDVASGRELRTLKGHIAYVTHLGPMGGVSVAFSPNGLYLLSGGCASHDAKNECIEGALKLWNIGTGQQLHEFTGHAGEVSSVAFSPDGDRAVSSSYDKTLKLWDISEWTRQQVARH
jgi:WD40 repeat protein